MDGNQGMGNLIRIISKLQDKFIPLGLNLDIDLPQIVVVGGQSSGKSSVLESFVGRDFLPRGSGIVTRRPLLLQLIPSRNETCGKFLHAPNKTFHDFDEIRREIENETYRLTGDSKGISPEPISLKIYSPDVLNLTLVDLPGLTKIAVGNQPKDIEIQLRNMVLNYIENDNCLILAVTAANQDLATSDALQIAKEVDPNGERTIGVLTKIDLMDEGTTAREVLDNKLLPLRRGYIGVINRSQKDIERKKSIQSTLEDEDKFFSEHQAYRDIADKLGTKYLQKYLNIELTRHIYSKIQSLKNILQKRLKETDGKLEPYRMFENEKQLERTFDHLKEEFRQAFELEIGRSASVFVNVSTLGHGAKIGRLINVLYQDDIKRISKDENELRREIVKAIQNIHGVHQGIFPPDMAFEAVIRLVIDKFSEPSMKCIDLVTEELEKLITDCTMKFSSYPTLRDIFTIATFECVHKCQKECRKQMAYMIDIQKAYMNTSHDDFVGFEFEQVEKLCYDNPTNQFEVSDISSSGVVRKMDWIYVKKQEYWFVLTEDSLNGFKDKDEKEQLYHVALAELQFSCDKKTIILYQLIGGQQGSFELKFKTTELAEEWKNELEKLSVKRHNTPKLHKRSLNKLTPSKQLDRHIENIKGFVDSYSNIMKETFRDFLPKLIYHAMINETKKFIAVDLRSEFTKHGSIEEAMIGTYDKAAKNDLLRQQEGIAEAIKLIDLLRNGHDINSTQD